jgi:hypothetical protein
MGIPELIELATKFGIGVLFLAMYLITAGYLYRELKASKKEVTDLTERVVTALDRASSMAESAGRIMDGLKQSMEENRAQTREFLAFLRGRDAGGRQP